jgi:large subunit ribosomal protein L25
MSEFTIEVEKREVEGKNANRRLRASGYIPAVVYGAKQDPVPIQVEKTTIFELLRQEGGEHSVFLLKLAGSKAERHTMVRELTVDPISRQILHIDFQRVLMTEKVRVPVPVEVLGEPEGVRNQGGVLDFVTREVEIECLPGDIPVKLEIDVSALEIGDHVEAKQIALPDKVELIDEPDRVLVAVSHSRVAAAVEEAEAVVEASEEGLLEAEEFEPEVIGKGKEEEEEEEESAE